MKVFLVDYFFMKKVAILSDHKWEYVFPKEMYRKPHMYMQEFFHENGLELAKVSLDHFDIVGQKFHQYIKFDDTWNILYINETYVPDIIFNRILSWSFYNYTTLKGLPLVPSFDILEISKDKYETYLFLSELMPTSYTLYNFFNNYDYIHKQISDKVVLKPINGSGWSGIEFFNKQELLAQKDKYKPYDKMYIVQDFKDFSGWYPWLVEWIHDLRMVFVWWSFSFSIIRQPKTWSLKSNIADWGHQFSLDESQIPSELFERIEFIMDKIWRRKNDIFSADFAYCKDEEKRYLLEINGSPGVRFPDKDKKHQDKYFGDLCRLFKSL